MLRRSLRVRYAVAIAAIALVLSAGISLTVSAITSRDLTDNARGAERTRVELAASLFARTGQVVVGAVRDDRAAPAPLRAAVAHGLLGTDQTPGVLWAGTPLPGGQGIYVEDSTVGNATTLNRLRRTLALVSVVATILAAGVGTLLSARLSQALRSAAGIADRVAAGDLAARVDAEGEDEVARLGRAIDEMTTALSARIDRERRFAADVAHELRTPLTALVTAGDLLDDGRPAELVRQQVAELRRLVEDLLEIFRLEGGSEQLEVEPVDLVRVAERLLAARRSEAEIVLEAANGGRADGQADGRADGQADGRADGQADGRTDGRGDGQADGRTQTDRRRLERVLTNLLDNAVRHGRPPVRVSIDGLSIAVSDAGPGFPEELLREGPAPFRTGSAARGTGTGLGLTIAEAQATLLGASLTFEKGPAGGARAVLTLPPV